MSTFNYGASATGGAAAAPPPAAATQLWRPQL